MLIAVKDAAFGGIKKLSNNKISTTQSFPHFFVENFGLTVEIYPHSKFAFSGVSLYFCISIPLLNI